ncbi:tetratricopeptide repeat protein [bacterium]|nr:tetratricopeptide repeat protein [bacterium]
MPQVPSLAMRRYHYQFVICMGLVFTGLQVHDAIAVEQDDWANRLITHAREVLAEEQLEQHRRSYYLSLTCSTLGRLGRAQQSIELATRYGEPKQQNSCLVLIAAALSESDYLAEALETADRLDMPFKQRAMVLVIARQAQRGDHADAMELLGQVADKSQQQDALILIAKAQLKQGKFNDAEQLIDQVEDNAKRIGLEVEMSRYRGKPLPGDADYEERTLEISREAMPTLTLEMDDQDFIRSRCRAEVALHANEFAAFVSVMKTLENISETWNSGKRFFAKTQILRLYIRSNDLRNARRVSEDILSSELTSTDVIDALWHEFADEEFFGDIVKAIPHEDLMVWMEKYIAADDPGQNGKSVMIGRIAGAICSTSGMENSQLVYKLCKTPRQRLRICVDVLDAYAKK